MKFKVGQKWKRRDGLIAKIISVNQPEPWPIQVEVDGNSGWIITLDTEGRQFNNLNKDADLMELVKPTHEIMFDKAQELARAITGTTDSVNNPSHYNHKGIECIAAIEASMEPGQFKGYLKGNIMKYLWRYEYKNGLEDLKKAQWYLNRLVTTVEKKDV